MSDYPNSGTLGKNKRQREGHKDPEYSGQCEVNGVAYWLSAWVKTGQDGSKFFSLSFKPKDVNQASKPAQAPPPSEDDVPF